MITLCDGKDENSWAGVQNMLSEELIPIMESAGFGNIELKVGPRFRGSYCCVKGYKKV